MKCPYCGHLGDKVVDSRESKEGEAIRRRRECLSCGRRFTSYERIDEIAYMVIKKGGTRERFDRQKLVNGLLKACEKRPVSMSAIEGVADRVEALLQERPDKEMSTDDIGGLVMDELRTPRQGGLRAVRVRVPALPRHRGVHERAEGPAELQGVTVTEPSSPAPPRRRASDRGRAPFLDNTRHVLVGIAALIAALVGLLILANRSTALAPDFLAEFVLYALVVTDLTIVVALVFVLTRNIVKLLVERRGSLPFARVRAKLVAVLLAMTLVPALLVSIVGSELIRNSVARWFDAPMGDLLASANDIAADYYRLRQDVVAARAARVARALGASDFGFDQRDAVSATVAADIASVGSGRVRVYEAGGRRLRRCRPGVAGGHDAVRRGGRRHARGMASRVARSAPASRRRRWNAEPMAPR